MMQENTINKNLKKTQSKHKRKFLVLFFSVGMEPPFASSAAIFVVIAFVVSVMLSALTVLQRGLARPATEPEAEEVLQRWSRA